MKANLVMVLVICLSNSWQMVSSAEIKAIVVKKERETKIISSTTTTEDNGYLGGLTSYWKKFEESFELSLLRNTTLQAMTQFKRLYETSDTRKWLNGFGRSLTKFYACMGGQWVKNCIGEKIYNCFFQKTSWACILETYCNAMDSGTCKFNVKPKEMTPQLMEFRKYANETLKYVMKSNCMVIVDCMADLAVSVQNKFNDTKTIEPEYQEEEDDDDDDD